MLKIETELDARGRVLVPREIRKAFKNRKIVLIYRNNELRIVPKISLRELRGITPGITTKGLRDERDRSV